MNNNTDTERGGAPPPLDDLLPTDEAAGRVMTCLHDDLPCTWWQHNPDNVGRNLGYGDGWASGRDFASVHAPMPFHETPVSDGRADDFAFGFFDGLVARWCVVHPWAEMQAKGDRCLAMHTCRKALTEHIETLRAEEAGDE